MTHSCKALCQLLTGAISSSGLSLIEWNEVVQYARSANVLGILYHRIEQRDEMDDVPEQVVWHLQSAAKIAAKYRRDALQEVERLLPLFESRKQKLILLKGAAYVLTDKPFAKGRTFSDIDLLIPKAELSFIESQLQWLGWGGGHHSDYDQRYYREWMHELPPLVHAKRGTVLDLHHTILPLTAWLKPDADALFQQVKCSPSQICTLALSDQLLHSATHLFMDSEFDHAFRDLMDFDGLFREAMEGQLPWQAILDRASKMDLLPPLYYALRYSQQMFDTPVPNDLVNALSEMWKPALSNQFMDWLMLPMLMPPHRDFRSSVKAWLAGKLLYMRGHALRMPLHLLACHLAYKAVLPFFKNTSKSAA